jgi:hypothetical protein
VSTAESETAHGDVRPLRSAHVSAVPIAAGLEFRHADGTPYGSPPFRHGDGTPCGFAPAPHSAPPDLLEARAFRALCGLGFGEREARRALTQVLRDLTPTAELATVLRRCLELLTENALAPPA